MSGRNSLPIVRRVVDAGVEVGVVADRHRHEELRALQRHHVPGMTFLETTDRQRSRNLLPQPPPRRRTCRGDQPFSVGPVSIPSAARSKTWSPIATPPRGFSSFPCAEKRRAAGSGSESRSPGRSPTRPSSSAPDHVLRLDPPSNAASGSCFTSGECPVRCRPRTLQMPRLARPRVAVKMLGLFAFHVRHPKAGWARQSELVGLLPSPESDLRHFGPFPFAGRGGYYEAVAPSTPTGIRTPDLYSSAGRSCPGNSASLKPKLVKSRIRIG